MDHLLDNFNSSISIKDVDYKTLYEKELIDKKYFAAKVKILESNLNNGDKDEILLLIELFYMNQTSRFNELVDIFGEEAVEGIVIRDTTQTVMRDISEFTKAGASFKADCIIEMVQSTSIYYISVKSKRCANPAILNHTPRTAKVFQTDGVLYDSLNSLDVILNEYIDKRSNKLTGEDISIKNLECTEDPEIQSKFINVLSYFVFDGSGKGYSSCRANAVIHYEDGKINFIKCRNDKEKKEYIQGIYDKMVISLRSKGMPKFISEYNKPWIFDYVNIDGVIKNKGSLHIRIN